MRSSLFIFCTLSVQLAASLTGPLLRHANADDTAGRAETQQAIISAWPHPSLDTYPVEFSIGGIHYRIPRNYLTTMENWKGGPQYIVTVAVNLPDLKPYSTETLPCFTTKAPERPPGCELLSFRINVPGGPPAEEVCFKNIENFFTASPQRAGRLASRNTNLARRTRAQKSTEKSKTAGRDCTSATTLGPGANVTDFASRTVTARRRAQKSSSFSVQSS